MQFFAIVTTRTQIVPVRLLGLARNLGDIEGMLQHSAKQAPPWGDYLWIRSSSGALIAFMDLGAPVGLVLTTEWGVA